MSEPITALEGAEFVGSVTVNEAGPQGMVTLRADLSSSEIHSVLGTEPVKRQKTPSDRFEVIWMSPDEVLLLCPYAEAEQVVAELDATLAGHHMLAVNVSDSRSLFTLSGRGARNVLAKLTPADLSPLALPAGEVRRSRLSQVPAAFWFDDAGDATILCFRSVSHYVMDLLKNASDPRAVIEYY